MAIYGHVYLERFSDLLFLVKSDREQKQVKEICRYLLRLRQEKKISQQRLSELAGISRTGLRHIESLRTSPTLYSLLKISKALEVRFDEIVRDVANESGPEKPG
ncbi:MAG: helix-turn-helix domain-containing protein [Opitutales bacterium]|nr:helix-turn-helix domain-containing protein [Opitutales bacterium]